MLRRVLQCKRPISVGSQVVHQQQDLDGNQNPVSEKPVMICPYDSFFIVKDVDGLSVEVLFELTVREHHSDSNDRL